MVSLTTVACGNAQQNTQCTADLSFKASEVELIQKHIGCEATVTGKVLSTYASKKTLFLNLDQSDYKKAFSAVIFKNNLHRFTEKGINDPLTYYDKKTITVKGMLKNYQQRPEIVAGSPKQIIIKGVH